MRGCEKCNACVLASEEELCTIPLEPHLWSYSVTYAHVCSRMLTYASVAVRVGGLYAGVCSGMLTYAHACSRMLTNASVTVRVVRALGGLRDAFVPPPRLLSSLSHRSGCHCV